MTNPSLQLSVCYCVYNEEGNIAECIKDAQNNLPEIIGNNYEILVIDNASTDLTPQVVEDIARYDAKVRLIRHPENRLYSGSYVTAFLNAEGNYIAIIDGDNQHTTRDIKNALRLLEQDSYDVIFGWKKSRKGSLIRKIFSLGLRYISKFLIGNTLHDINCGYRVLKREAAHKICIKERINAVGPELYCECKRLGLKIGEIVVQHFPRTQGKGMHDSLLPLIKNSLKFITYLYRLRRRYRSSSFEIKKEVS